MINVNILTMMKRTLRQPLYAPVFLVFLLTFTLFSSGFSLPVQAINDSAARQNVSAAADVDALSLSNEERAFLRRLKVLRVYSEDNWPPFSFLQDGKARGYSIDYFTAIANRLGIEFEHVQAPSWSEGLSMARDKELDVVLNVTHSPDREGVFNFTLPFLKLNRIYVTRDANRASMDRVEDLSGKTIAVIEGYYMADLLKDFASGAIPYVVTNELEKLQAVLDGKADAAVMNETLFDYLVAEHDLEGLAADRDIDTALLSRQPSGMAVRKDWPLLANILSKAIATFPEVEEERLKSKWRMRSKRTNVALDLTPAERDFLRSIDRVRVQNDADWPPYNYNQDGVPQGYSIDYFNLVADIIGLDVEYVQGHTWETYLDMFMDKKLDVLLNLSQTPDRERFMLFTQPYLTADFVYVVRAQDAGANIGSADFDGKTLAIVKSTWPEEFHRENFEDIRIYETGTYREALEAVAQGRADTTVIRAGVFRHLIDTFLIPGLVVDRSVETTLMSNKAFRIGVRKDWPLMASIISKAMSAIPVAEKQKLHTMWLKEKTQSEPSSIFTGAERDFLKQHPVIRVSNEQAFYPFDFVENDKPAGFSIDVLKLIEPMLGVRFEFYSDLNWEVLLNMARDKQLDLMHTIWDLPSRREFLHFTDSYTPELTYALAVRDDETTINSLSDLTERTLAIMPGEDGPHQYVLERVPGIKQFHVSNPTEGLRAVSLGQADAYYGQIVEINYLVNRNFLSNLKTVGTLSEEFSQPAFKMAVREDWPMLRDILNKALKALPEEELNAVRNRWLAHTASARSPAVLLNWEEEAWVLSHKKLTVATLMNAPPFDFRENNVSRGIASDVIAQIANNLDIRFEQRYFPDAEQLASALASGAADLVQLASIHDDRLKDVRFTSPVIRSQQVILGREPSDRLRSLEDYNGRTVGISDYLYSEQLFDYYPKVDFELFDDVERGMQALKYRRVDAFVTNLEVAEYALQRAEYSELHQVGRVGIPSLETLFGIGVNKNNLRLIGVLQKSLDALSQEQMAVIHSKWLGNQQGRTIAAGVRLTPEERQFLQQNNSLRMCVTPGYMPSEDISSTGQHIGVVADYMRLIALRLGVKLQLVQSQDWAETIEFAQTRQCDFIPNITDLPARRTFLDFTRSYLDHPTVLVTRDDEVVIASLESVIDQPISIVKSSAKIDILARDFPDKSFQHVDTPEEGLRRVSSGEHFGHMASMINATYLINKTRLTNLKVSGQTPYVERISIGTRNDQPLLNSIFDKAIATITDQEHQEIFSRWNRVRVESEVDYTLMWQVVGGGSFVLLLIVAWNRKLAALNTRLAEAHTELKNTQQQLLMQEKMASLGTLTSGVAHEINNPANFTYASVHLINEELDRVYAFLRELAGGDQADDVIMDAIQEKFAKLHKHADTASEGTRRIKNIVKDLRTFTRLEEGEKSRVPIGDVIQSTVHLVRTKHRDIYFNTKLAANPECECFPSKLGQVFMNILVNACDAIHERKADEEALEGEIVIRTRHDDNMVVIEFEDNGCGMTAETKDKLFEPFYTTKDVGTGTGLGMAISFGVIQDHGGGISVVSNRGEGSTFIIRLPLD